MVFDECSWMRGVERVLDLDGDVLDADGVDGWRIDDLGAEVTELHGLYVRQLVDGVCRLDDAWVGSHEAVNVRPDLQHFGIERCGNDGSRIVRTATSQIGRLARIAISADEARYHGDGLAARGCVIMTTNRFKGLLDQPNRQFRIQNVLAELLLRADEAAAIHAHTVFHEVRHDIG